MISLLTQSTYLENLSSSAKAYLIAQWAEENPIVIITSGERDSPLLDEVGYFNPVKTSDFCAWETLPSDEMRPSYDVMGRRIDFLKQASSLQVVTMSVHALLQKTLPSETIENHQVTLKKGEHSSFEKLPKLLEQWGYTRCTQVLDKGQYAYRGGIIDVFCPDQTKPYRIDFFGDDIDSIRTFDLGTQKSIDKIPQITISLADESLFIKEKTVSVLDYFKNPILYFDDIVGIEEKVVSLKKAHSNLFSSFTTLVQKHKMVLHSKDPLEKIGGQVLDRELVSVPLYDRSYDSTRYIPPFLSLEQLISIEGTFKDKLERLIELKSHLSTDSELNFVYQTEKEKKCAEPILLPLPFKVKYTKGYLSSSLFIPSKKIGYLSSSELSDIHLVHRDPLREGIHAPTSTFHELEKGDLVVHLHNGVGKYCGIEKQKDASGAVSEFMKLEYKNGGTLFVPLSQSHLVTRYIGGDSAPVMHELGTKKWQKAKLNAEKAIMGYAKELLEVQAARELKGGFTYPIDSEEMQLFEAEFPYRETEDQLKAIEACKKDMCSSKAMDRLVCGDVGYGKTEVALRMAAKAALDGSKQVALLAPTTILALQHYETFKERLTHFPINLGILTGLQTPKQNKETLAKLNNGEIDIVVGTHKLVSKSVTFKDLGLLIIDEEQKFGVKVKENLKQKKEGVDSLTLSATPIPRTLYLSLVQAKDMSVIATPPHDRLPVKTLIVKREEKMIQEAIQRELLRDGQVYFIHNRVESIYRIASELQKLAPQAKLGITHGQMDPKELQEIFHAFKQGEIDILVSTTLLENGIDVPNANTIFIDRAHHFGLSDLYQLRGRVGRWNKAAYSYFLVPSKGNLSEDAKKRLQALVEASVMGGGLKVAMRDLEIRGGGDILGTLQSGHVSSIGFNLYCKLLNKTIHALQKSAPPSFIETRIETKIPAQIPSSYIPESALRLELYYRLGNCLSEADVDEIADELTDRFGRFPSEVEWLLVLTKIKILASSKHFTSLHIEDHKLLIVCDGKKQQFRLPPLNTPKDLLHFFQNFPLMQ